VPYSAPGKGFLTVLREIQDAASKIKIEGERY